MDVKLACEQGAFPGQQRKTWETQSRFVITFDQPKANGAGEGRGSLDYGGVTHPLLAFATSQGLLSATGQIELKTYYINGKIMRASNGDLAASGEVKLDIDTTGKMPGVWLGTACKGSF